MRASARLVADRSGLSRVRSEPPLLLRRTGTAPDGAVVVHLVGGAAGPLGGDDLSLHVEVAAGAALEIHSVAASVALPGRGESVMHVSARIAEGGVLRWYPQPLVAAAGCRHRCVSTVDIAAGGRLTWRDVLVCGRHGEDPGDVRLGLTVRYGGRELLVHELSVGPSAPGWAGPAVLGGARAVGAELVVDPSLVAAAPAVLGETAAVLQLAGPGVLRCAVGADATSVLRDLGLLLSLER